MTSINSQMGLKPAGKRKRLASLSGVPCPVCRHVDVTSTTIHGRLVWTCRGCSHQWEPTLAEIQRYNGRVRDRDRIVLS